MKYLLRYTYNNYGPIEGGSYNPTIRVTQMYKPLLFHHLDDVNNWLRNHLDARILVKLEIEFLQVE